MNKYQKAYDYLSLYIASCPFEDTEEDSHIEYGTQSHFKFEQWKTIKELVDRATPKKPLIDENWEMAGYYYVCPNCRSLLCKFGKEYDYGFYCSQCGQELDWSEEDDKGR